MEYNGRKRGWRKDYVAQQSSDDELDPWSAWAYKARTITLLFIGSCFLIWASGALDPESNPSGDIVTSVKRVVAMSWCPNDSSYLLTCAKDNRTICWDTNSAEIVSELPAGTNWNFDVHWYPKIPGVISASSFDGKISIYNIEACARYGVGESYLVSMNPSYKRTTIDNLFDGINKTFAVVGKVLPGV